MTPADEKKLLARVLRHLDAPQENILVAKWFLPVAWIVCFLMFFMIFRFSDRLNHGGIAIAFGFLGICIGFVAFARVCARQDPIMRRHMDRESIVRRLDELEG